MFPVRLTAAGLSLASARSGDCLKYVVDLAAAAQRRVGARAALTTSSDWLWSDAAAKSGTVVRVQFDLPPGMRLSVPWPATDASAAPGPAVPAAAMRAPLRSYRVPLSSRDWPDRIAIGALQQWRIDAAGARLQVSIVDATATNAAVTGSLAQLQRSLVGPWLEEAAAVAATIHGRFPAPAPEILVVPAAADGHAVRASSVFDSGRRTVLLAIDPRHSLPEYRADPTAIAAFMRLLLPPMRPDARWLVDGLALYYQDVARVRYGTLSIPEAWVRLHAGMTNPSGDAAAVKGPRNSPDAWTGARLWLLADTRLRDGSGGMQSLDGALAQLARCCLAPERHFTAAQLWQRLDALTRSPVFSTLQQELASAAGLTAAASLFDDLGIHIAGDELEIDDAAPLACVRENILQAQRLKTCTVKETQR
jgi:hypothetical protein